MAKETKIAEVKLFDKWSFEGVMVVDQGLQGYLNIEPIVVPRTNGYYHNTAFYKTKVNIVERLMNRFQVSGHKGKKHKISSGHNTGNVKSQANIMIEVLEALERKTKENPIQVLVTAIEHAAPREEVITIERSGAKYAQAVDIGPQRRIDLVLRYICQGAAHKAFDAQVSFVDCLVAEIMAAYNIENSGMAMTRRSEIEKMAAAAK
jgi:small subunit ribosomal protein S7